MGWEDSKNPILLRLRLGVAEVDLFWVLGANEFSIQYLVDASNDVRDLNGQHQTAIGLALG